ncbi:MAG: class I SAM-dependent methyltransferase [Gemmatimonadota bacterium]
MTDVWGKIYKDQHHGTVARHSMERDDGRMEVFESAAGYFEAPRSEEETDLLAELEEPVLDLAAGVGSYTLYLQEKGLDVTAADYSPGALEVCRERGCRKVRQLDLRDLELEPGSFRSVIIMGNTLGAHQTPASLPYLFRSLRRAVRPNGRLLCSTVDPLDTAEEAHLAYHERNRRRGLPPGLVRMRMMYGDLVDDWMLLWLMTESELLDVATKEQWTLLETRAYGPFRARLFERSEGEEPG